MTTATPEAAGTNAAPATAPEPPLKPLDEFGQMALTNLKQVIDKYNGLASRVKAATGDPGALLDNLRETYTEDETVNKIRAAIEELDNKREALFTRRDEILKPVVEAKVAEAKEGLGGAEEEANDLLKTVRAGLKYISDLYDERHLKDLPPLVGKAKSTGGGQGGSGRRIRGFDVYVDGTLSQMRDGKGEKRSNLATAAKEIGVDTEVLRDAFFRAAGTEDSAKYPATVEFTVSVDEKGEDGAVKQVTKSIRCVKVNEGEARATESETPAEAAANSDA